MNMPIRMPAGHGPMKAAIKRGGKPLRKRGNVPASVGKSANGKRFKTMGKAVLVTEEVLAEMTAGSDYDPKKQLRRQFLRDQSDVVVLLHPSRVNDEGDPAEVEIPAHLVDHFINDKGFGYVKADGEVVPPRETDEDTELRNKMIVERKTKDLEEKREKDREKAQKELREAAKKDPPAQSAEAKAVDKELEGDGDDAEAPPRRKRRAINKKQSAAAVKNQVGTEESVGGGSASDDGNKGKGDDGKGDDKPSTGTTESFAGGFSSGRPPIR